MHPRPTPKRHPCRRIALIKRKVQIDPHLHDAHPAVEMHGQQMGLRAVGLPEVVRGGGEEGGDAAGGLRGGDLPGGEGGDFAEVGGEGWVLGWWGLVVVEKRWGRGEEGIGGGGTGVEGQWVFFGQVLGVGVFDHFLEGGIIGVCNVDGFAVVHSVVETPRAGADLMETAARATSFVRFGSALRRADYSNLHLSKAFCWILLFECPSGHNSAIGHIGSFRGSVVDPVPGVRRTSLILPQACWSSSWRSYCIWIVWWPLRSERSIWGWPV